MSYSGNATSGATLGHGLGVSPKFIMIKNRDQADAWLGYTTAVDGTLDYFTNGWGGTNAKGDSGLSLPTSSVFSIHSDDTQNASGENYIAYCFAEKKGYSKFGSYIGNGNADGTFVYTGFKPAFVMIKHTSGAGNNWEIFDNKRVATSNDALGNPVKPILYPNTNGAEAADDRIDILSNGFKFRNSYSGGNGSGQTYIYIAFGQSLVGSNNVPCTAR